jgi:glycolate oxidase
VTTNHVLGLEAVLADGSVVRLGGAAREAPGYDLRGVLIGSEGTLAIVTKATVCLLRRPEAVRTLLAVYEEMDDASAAVSSIVASGIVPAAIEMMDDVAIAAVEPTVNAGYPGDAGAVLLVEVDGLAESVQEQSEEVEDICGRFRPMEIRTAADAAERERLWAGRKGAIGALGRLAPSYYLVDGTIPRTRLMEVMAKIKEISAESGYQIANVLHAGDGNLHPCILFDERSEEDTREALEVGGRILKLCVEVGGVLSGEHGIGTEKQEYMPLMFTDADMEAMAGLKPAFGADGMFNPGKIFPTGGSCVDIGQMSAVARAGAGAYI